LVIQIYPAGSDRLDAKGVRELIAVFSEIKKRGYSVFLLLINQAADDHDNQATMDHYKRFGEDRGLVYGEDFAFISDFFPGFAAGTPKRTVIELSMYSNVFVFPSQHETFGLVLPETSLVSGALPVLNKSLPEMLEVGGMHGLLVDFGSYFVEWKPKDEEAYFEHLAGQIIYMMHSEEGIRAKTWNRLEYNRASIYERYYVPILQGRNLWT
jgi:glycosyltransferase involved in cell wall biosynthesis